MAEPARRRAPRDDAPALDPNAIRRAYRMHRAKRQARVEQMRARRYAQIRFFIVILVLLGLSFFLALTVWREIERLFGL